MGSFQTYIWKRCFQEMRDVKTCGIIAEQFYEFLRSLRINPIVLST